MTAANGDGRDLLYRRPVSVWWWTRKRSYFLFVMRELSSLFIGWLVLYLLLLIRAISRGEAAYLEFLEEAASPWLVGLNVVALGFVLLHTVTWFSLTPRAMVVSLGSHRVPAAAIIGVQYAGLVAVSAFVYWLVTR